MAHIFIAWELGEGLGHLGSFPLLVRRLTERGHRVTLAIKDLAGGERVLGDLGVPVLQAPLWQGSHGRQPLAASYAELLARVGYLQADALIGRLRAWRALLELTGPDLAILNHAPTALLASRGMGLVRVIQGTGFTCPVTTGPRPVFPLWAAVDAARPAALEERLLGSIEHALETVGAPPLLRLERSVEADDRLLCTLPELDPYRTLRRSPEYRGPVPSQTGGLAAEFPMGPGPRIFAYLKQGYAPLAPLLEALRRGGASVLAYVSGISSDQAREWSGGSMRVCERPLDLSALLATSDLAIHHGGHGICADALLAGVPNLVLPLHVENWVNGRSIEAAGAGWVAGWERAPEDPAALLRRALSDDSARERARRVAAAHAGLDREARILAIARRIDELLVAGGVTNEDT